MIIKRILEVGLEEGVVLALCSDLGPLYASNLDDPSSIAQPIPPYYQANVIRCANQIPPVAMEFCSHSRTLAAGRFSTCHPTPVRTLWARFLHGLNRVFDELLWLTNPAYYQTRSHCVILSSLADEMPSWRPTYSVFVAAQGTRALSNFLSPWQS